MKSKIKTPIMQILRGPQGLRRECFVNPLSGAQSVEQSAKICNRCGACLQSCPSYRALRQEQSSPRGRNQLLRFILDKRLPPKTRQKDILRPALSCVMCGACAAACAANAPAHKHMMEIKNLLRVCVAGAARNAFLRAAAKRPQFFYALKGARYKLPKDAWVRAFFMPSAAGVKNLRKDILLVDKKRPGVAIIKSGLYLGESALSQPPALLRQVLDNILAEYGAILSASPLPIVAADIELYRALKLSPEYGAKYAPLASAASYITDFLPSLKTKGAKILTQDNNILFCGDKIPQDTQILLHSTLGPRSAGLLPYARVEGAKIIEAATALRVAAHGADYLVVFSAREQKYFARLLRRAAQGTKVVHISLLTEHFDGAKTR